MSTNQFLAAIARNTFFTENGAVSNATTGSALLNYFSKCGTYRDRNQEEVDKQFKQLWAESPRLSLMLMFYTRIVTRKSEGFLNSETVQKGQGARDEFRKSLHWLARTHPKALATNLWLVPLAGRWSDLWHVDVIDVLPRKSVFQLVRRGIQDPYNRPLIAKYLPRLRSPSQTFNDRHRKLNAWAQEFAAFNGWTRAQYRRFKSNPEHRAHQFQRMMCAGLWDQLDFRSISGRALFSLVGHRGRDGKTTLERHGLTERYDAWIMQQPVAKFTGYPYELYQAARKGRLTRSQILTFGRQFEGLVQRAKEDRGGITENLWCALDTSGSMGAQVVPGVSALDICLGLGLYFSALNEGTFQNHVVMFDSTSRLLQLKGSFCERVRQLHSTTTAWGSTNFQSVIDLICQVRRQKPNIPVSEFPTTLLVVSDMQFNPVGGNTETNYKAAMKKLAAVGLPHIKIVWWWVTGRGGDFPSTINDRGVTMIGGFDGAILELLLGGEQPQQQVQGPNGTPAPSQKTPYDQMLTALDQELLRQVSV